MVLEVSQLEVALGQTAILRDISLSVDAGETVAVVGASGSGKTTFARSVLGLLGNDATVTADRFVIDGVLAPPPGAAQWRAIRGKKVGYVPQDPANSLNPVRRIGSQVREALRLSQQPDSDREVAARLHAVGLVDSAIARRYPQELSGGQRQRVLIAMALAARPRLIVADEPTSALDADVSEQVLDLITAQAGAGAGLILITHDLALAARRADRVVVFDDGQIVESGTASAVLTAPSSAAAQRLRAAMPGRGTPSPRNTDAAITLEAAAVGVRIGSVPILTDVDLQVRTAETVAVVGPSGSGKSTLGRVLTGLTKPTAGTVTAKGQVQLVSQNPFSALDPRWTVRRIVGESLHPRRGWTTQRKRERVAQALDEVGLGGKFLDRRPRELSGGQCQRVAIARAIAPRPAVVVLDEAVSALDVVAQARVLEILQQLQTANDTSYLFITHDRVVAQDIAHRFVDVTAGRVVAAS